jgi:hypothetical protein
MKCIDNSGKFTMGKFSVSHQNFIALQFAQVMKKTDSNQTGKNNGNLWYKNSEEQ